MRPPWVAITLFMVAGCGDTEELTLHSGPDPTHEQQLFRAVLQQLTSPAALPVKGNWPADYGDANVFGPGLFLRYGAAGQNSLQLQVGQDNTTHNAQVLTDALKQLGTLMAQLEEVIMASFGLMEAHTHAPDDKTRKLLDQTLDVINAMARGVSYYPADLSVGKFGVSTYGPSSTNASLALLNFEYALFVGGALKQKRADTALEILDKGRQKGLLKDKGYYAYSSKTTALYLYPQVTQMLAHLRAYQLTGKKLYLDRARDLHKAIQPLKVKGEGRYRSPYSAKEMGAKTDDYTTLSSQNYTLMALALLHRYTGEASLKQEILDILAFLRTHLLHSDGKVLHHWIDGKVVPTDHEVAYCSGCNLQLLYIIWRLPELLEPAK